MKRVLPDYRNPLSALGSPLVSFGAVAPTTQAIGVTNNAFATWPSANAAIFMPIRIIEPTLIVNIAVSNGTLAGNTDVGIYSLNGVRLVSSGSTAQAGSFQTFDIADTMLGPGVYYAAVARDEATTGTTFRHSFASNVIPKIIGMAEMAAAFPLPATATLATITSNYIVAFSLGTAGSGVL